MQLANAFLATRDIRDLEEFARCGGKEEFVTILRNPLFSSRFRTVKQKQNISAVPKLELDSGGNVLAANKRLGQVQKMFLRPFPIEPRLHAAYEIMYEEFVKYLFRHGFPMVGFDGHLLSVFIQEGQLFTKNNAWESFIEFTFDANIELIQRNYYALAALHQLGMGPPAQPIFSESHALLLVAFCRTAWVKSKWQTRIEKELESLNLLKKVGRLDQLFKGKPRAAGQYGFFQKADEVGKYVFEVGLPKLKAGATYEVVPYPFIAEAGYLGSGMDFIGRSGTNRFCYGCGRTMNKEETFTSSKLVYESSKQRPQSGFREMQEKIFVCNLCFFAHLFSPLYPESENVLVEVRPQEKKKSEMTDVLSATMRIESTLRGAVLNEVGLVSGRFFELREAKSDNKKAIGNLPYLYYKLSRVPFAPRFIKENQFTLLGEGESELSEKLILLLRSFKNLNLFAYNTSERKEHEMTMKSVISSPPKPFEALYHYAHTQNERNDWSSEIDDIHQSIVQNLGGEKMTKQEEFERIIGVAKIFDAFIETANGKNKADFQKLAQSIDGVEILGEFGYRFAELADPSKQRPFVNDKFEPTAYMCAKKVLTEVGAKFQEEVDDRGHSIQLNLDALKAVMLQVLKWNEDNTQGYQRFMNKVKYDVLARHPEQLKTRRGEK